MTINCKFDVGQSVWIIYEREAVVRVVNMVTGCSFIEGGNKRIDIYYDLKHTPGRISEKYVFETKEALLQSL